MARKRALPIGASVEGCRILSQIEVALVGYTYLVEDERDGQKGALFEYLHGDIAGRADNGIGVEELLDINMGWDFGWRLAMFRETAEGLVTKALSHPFLDAPRRLIIANGTVYFLSDYRDSVPLKLLVEKQGPFDEAELDDLLFPLLDALDYLHDRGVVHAGIEPRAVRITDDGTPRLCRFGFWEHDQISPESTAWPRLECQPPEFLARYQDPPKIAELSPASDLYALSALCLWALTGIEAPSAMRLLSIEARRRSDAPAMREGVSNEIDPVGDALAPLIGRVRPELIATLRAGLALDQKDRPQSAEAFRAMLGSPVA